jgi:hypothetical protein
LAPAPTWVLVGAMRKDIGYFLTSISSSTQHGCSIGTLSRAISGVAASASPELSGPKIMRPSRAA